MVRGYLYAAAALALVGAFIWYGHTRYTQGVRDTTAEFVKADKEGARNVRLKAREVLTRIGDNPDVDKLLRDTGGLRD